MADRGPQRSEDRSVTDKDREAALAAMRAADHAQGTRAKTECYAQAIAAARAEEREACIAAIVVACPKAHTYASENADIYMAQDHMVDMAIAAIRARGED